MCIPGIDPLTIGLVLSAGSAAANHIGARKVQKARDGALSVERLRKQKLQREADAVNAKSRDRYVDFEDQQGETSSKLTDYFTQAPQSADEAVGEANATAGSVMPSATNDIVQKEIEKQSGLADAFTSQQAGARGRLRSFGDLLGGISRDQARDAGKIGQIGGFQQGSANVLAHELESAGQAGSGAQFFGDVLGGLGSIATTGGITARSKAGTLPGWLNGGKLGGLV
ncbi:hypothetical protein PhaeoP66_03203 [Phaeobacter inhibens]|uniref:Uncharacterized protein n=1 Tax=Phaeobacter inhibens TaxID=221822 RepID=A0ABN5GQY6_9RHOB|nr:hypothetical protein PhaeoP66_03203 [Phaeobacter inhibens]